MRATYWPRSEDRVTLEMLMMMMMMKRPGWGRVHLLHLAVQHGVEGEVGSLVAGE